MDPIPYLQRGILPVETSSSMLISSSKYLNDPRLREWVATITLKRNGPDIPPATEMYQLIRILDELRDDAYVEALIARERQINPTLDQWFSEGFCSKFDVAYLSQFAPGTLGGIFHHAIVSGGFDLVIYDLPKPKTPLEYFIYRSSQSHDLEHIITGGDFTAMGELVPAWCRITNHFKHLSPELASELSIPFMFVMMRYTIRTMLHYPTVWTTCQAATERGMRVGHASDCLFMARYEDVFHLPLAEARAALGVREAEDLDARAASEVWLDRGPRNTQNSQ